MSPKFNSKRVVCPDKHFLTVCFFFQVESSRFSKQQNKLVLTLNSFRNGALFGISLDISLELIEALSSPLAKCRKSWAQSFLGEKISPSNGTCSLDCLSTGKPEQINVSAQRVLESIASDLRRCYTRQFLLQLVPQFCRAVARQVARNVA